ncbi:MAG: hypothetical protein WBL65_27385 [Bryobacteraceae bacterium]
MRQKWLLQIVPAVLLASVAAAQTGTALSGPTMGLVFDASQSALRPIRGIPGAATLGDAVNPGFPLASATVSPRQDFALALRADDSSVVLALAGGGSAAVSGARPAPELMVFSPAGATAALYDSSAGRVQVLTGLPDAAAVQSDVDISALAGPVAALAVDDAGSTLFLAAGAAETVALYRIGMDGTSQYMASFRSVAALRLSGTGREALVADSAAGAVYAIRDLRGAGRMETIASGRDGLGTPIAVESDSAGRIFVADQAGNVTILNRGRGPVVSLPCGCTPTGLFRLSGTATFRLTEPSDGPMWVLDASGADARIVAVPPAAPPAPSAADNGGGQ